MTGFGGKEDSQAKYIPTPAQIRAAAANIKETNLEHKRQHGTRHFCESYRVGNAAERGVTAGGRSQGRQGYWFYTG